MVARELAVLASLVGMMAMEGKLVLVENALTSMGQRLEKVEHNVETLESHRPT